MTSEMGEITSLLIQSAGLLQQRMANTTVQYGTGTRWQVWHYMGTRLQVQGSEAARA